MTKKIEAPTFPKRGTKRQKIDKGAKDSKDKKKEKIPTNISSCARDVANYRYKKDVKYQAYVKAKATARVAQEKADRAKKKKEEEAADRKKRQPQTQRLNKMPKAKKPKSRAEKVAEVNRDLFVSTTKKKQKSKK